MEPLVLEDYIKEKWPRLEPKVQACVLYYVYLRVTIICRYIFLQFWSKVHFACTNICNLYVDMVKGSRNSNVRQYKWLICAST